MKISEEAKKIIINEFEEITKTVSITRNISSNNNLSSLNASIGTFDIAFDKDVTVLPDGMIPFSGKKRDLESLINRGNIQDVVINFYRDRSGSNDLKRMQSLGFEIQAYYKGEAQGSIPPRDYYYMRRDK